MSLPNDLSRCLTEFDPHTTLIAVVELSLSSWLVAGMVPGMERNPLKKMAPDEAGLLRLLEKWREEAIKAGSTIRYLDPDGIRIGTSDRRVNHFGAGFGVAKLQTCQIVQKRGDGLVMNW